MARCSHSFSTPQDNPSLGMGSFSGSPTLVAGTCVPNIPVQELWEFPIAAVMKDCKLSAFNSTHALAYSSTDKRPGTGPTRLQSLACGPYNRLSSQKSELIPPRVTSLYFFALLLPLPLLGTLWLLWATWITQATLLFL